MPIGLDAHLSFVRQRWEAGCHNLAQVSRELVARGYSQSYETMYEQVVRLLPEGKKNASRGRDLSAAPVSSRQAMFLLLRPSAELKPDEQATLLMLRHLAPAIDRAYDLVQQLAHMLRTRTAEQLDGWLEQATTSKIRALQSFV